MTPVLTTSRFTLRPLQAGDEAALFTGFSDPATMQYWSRAPFADLADFRTWLDAAEWPNATNRRMWIAVPHAGGQPVAQCGMAERGDQVAEIGYMVMPGHTRQGVAGECVAALLTQLFRVEGFHRVFADTDPRNIASNRLLQSLGFTREAHVRSAMKTHIGWCDTWLWGLLADEWRDL
jgi:RimJ/RimL family protein N-acetyltransferase